MGNLINQPPVPTCVLDALAKLCASCDGVNLYAHKATVNALAGVDMDAALWLHQNWFRHADVLYALAKHVPERTGLRWLDAYPQGRTS